VDLKYEERRLQRPFTWLQDTQDLFVKYLKSFDIVFVVISTYVCILLNN